MMKLSHKYNKYSTTSELFDIKTEVEILLHIQNQIGNISSVCFRFIREKNPLLTEDIYRDIIEELGKINDGIETMLPDMEKLAGSSAEAKTRNFANIKYNRTKLMDWVRQFNVLLEIEKEPEISVAHKQYAAQVDEENAQIISFLDYYQKQTGEDIHTPLPSLLLAQARNEQKKYEKFLAEMEDIGMEGNLFEHLRELSNDLKDAIKCNNAQVGKYIDDCVHVRKKFERMFPLSLASLKQPIHIDKIPQDIGDEVTRTSNKISPKDAREIRQQLFAVTRSMERTQQGLTNERKKRHESEPIAVTHYFKHIRRALLTTLGAAMGAAFAYGPAKDFAALPKVPPKAEDAFVEKNPIVQDPKEEQVMTKIQEERVQEMPTVASQKVLEHMLHEMTNTYALRGVHIGSYTSDGQVYVPFTLAQMQAHNPSFAKEVQTAQEVSVVAIYKKDKQLCYTEGTQYGNGHWSVKPEGFVPITVAIKVTQKDGTSAYHGVGSMDTPRVMVPEMKKESQVLFNEYIEQGVHNAKSAVEKNEAFTPPQVVNTPVVATPLHKTIEEGVRTAKGEEAPKGLWAKTKNLLGGAAKKVGSFWK